MLNNDMPSSSKQTMLQPGYLSGHVVHHRYSPKEHRFTDRMYWHLVAIDDLNSWCQQSLFRSHNGFNIYGLCDRDYVVKDKRSISIKLNEYLQQQTGEVFNGHVLLMTHPRFINVGFNSVSFYFCYQQDQLTFIVSEINNTPWGDKQLYFHDCRQQDKTSKADTYDFSFDKTFHISPFVPMDIHYQWRFKVNAEGVDVHMKLSKDGDSIMYVGMQTLWCASDTKAGLSLTVRRPAQAWKMWLNIYYQAARLWLKKIPFYNHPNS